MTSLSVTITDNSESPIRHQFPYVASGEPLFAVYHLEALRRQDGVLVVTHGDVPSSNQDLPAGVGPVLWGVPPWESGRGQS